MSKKGPSWQEDVRERLLDEEKSRRGVKSDISIAKARMDAVWNEISQINDSLDSDIRLSTGIAYEEVRPDIRRSSKAYRFVGNPLCFPAKSECLLYDSGESAGPGGIRIFSRGLSRMDNGDICITSDEGPPILSLWVESGSLVIEGFSVEQTMTAGASAAERFWIPRYRYLISYSNDTASAILKNICMGDALTRGLEVIDTKDRQRSGDKRCFIATAACGSDAAPDVLVLRCFRDECLLNSRTGQSLVRAYYRLSPPVAKFIEDKFMLRAIIRIFLISPLAFIATHSNKRKLS